ncbi:MAG: peptide/nickel transport system substrate-binding protein [Frankiaceae bacterium]|jgi:peptide/nickel transport system substrate-binding protein|nr:peptide/nickel transport system substrate-binding protein [Frankiaceae bacterium]
MRSLTKAAAALAVTATAVTACGGGSGTQRKPGQQVDTGNFDKSAANTAGTPSQGGVLNVLGVGDVDFLDPNITYYSVGYEIARLMSRQLYTYPAITGKTTTVVPDLATSMPDISADGTTYRITIRQGAKWNTEPERQVTAADLVRGLKVTCNPSQPFGGLTDFSDLIKGYGAFCDGFAKVETTASAIADYVKGHDISGVAADPSNPLTVVFTLTHPATYFTNMLSLPPFSPRPIESMSYVPASAQLAQHTLSDGPYEVKSYNPTHAFVLVRNHAWDATTDNVRKAYVDEIRISETGNQDTIQQQLQTNVASADMAFDTGTPSTVVPELLAADDPNLNVQSGVASNPYIVFNTASPNNDGALRKPEVRQAIEFALDRDHLIQDAAGPKVSPPLTHILPPTIDGSEVFDLYPHSTERAKQMLQDAGVQSPTLKFLYRPASATSQKMFQTVQADLGDVGIKVKGVPVPNADFYVKYMIVPQVARRGVWDLSLAGWGPDWYGDAALSFFGPLFDGRVLPPSSSNFGLFNDPAVNTLIDKAKVATNHDESTKLWAQADRKVMEDAAIFPITDPNTPVYHGSQVHNAIFLPVLNQFDMANVWLEPGKSGG